MSFRSSCGYLETGTDMIVFSCLLVLGERVVKVSFVLATDSESYR